MLVAKNSVFLFAKNSVFLFTDHSNESNAVKLKKAAVKLGYIQSIHRYKEFMIINPSDYKMRNFFYENSPKDIGKIRYWSKKIDGANRIKAVIQLYDQIVPNIQFKGIKKLSALHLPLEVEIGLKNQNSTYTLQHDKLSH
jgi:hypothetical protein